MNYKQYEELCRFFLANELGIPIEKVISDKIPSATRPGVAEYENQIDLYWKYEDKLTRIENFANAKWRSSDKDKVDQGDVLLIQQVKQEIAANKAMMITNTDFTDGARKAAKNHGIALHIVRPTFDCAVLHQRDSEIIQTQLREYFIDNKPPYTHEVVYRAFNFGADVAEQSSDSSKTSPYSEKVVSTSLNRMAQPPSHRRAPSGTQKAQGGQGGARTGGRGGSVQKRMGPPRGGGGRSNRGR